MFDITSSKLLLLGIVALIVIGPKDLPVLLRTIGKYVGVIRRHAAEFRAQFEEAMRESELDQLKKDVESMGREAEASMREAERSVTTEIDAAKAEVQSAADTALLERPAEKPADPHAHDADGLPQSPDEARRASLNGGEPHAQPGTDVAGAGTETRADAAPGTEGEAEHRRAEQKAGA